MTSTFKADGQQEVDEELDRILAAARHGRGTTRSSPGMVKVFDASCVRFSTTRCDCTRKRSASGPAPEFRRLHDLPNPGDGPAASGRRRGVHNNSQTGISFCRMGSNRNCRTSPEAVADAVRQLVNAVKLLGQLRSRRPHQTVEPRHRGAVLRHRRQLLRIAVISWSSLRTTGSSSLRAATAACGRAWTACGVRSGRVFCVTAPRRGRSAGVLLFSAASASRIAFMSPRTDSSSCLPAAAP